MLYSDFITESARLLVDALEYNTSDPQKLIPAYALLIRIRLSSSSSVLAKAEEVIKTNGPLIRNRISLPSKYSLAR